MSDLVVSIAEESWSKSDPRIRDDVFGEVAMVLCEHIKKGYSTEDDLREVANRTRARLHCEMNRQPISLTIDIADARYESAPSGPCARTATRGQRKRLERNIVIANAVRSGISQRILSRVFGLARSRIAQICHEIDAIA